MSDSIQVNAENVDTTKVGTYIVSYSVTDSSGVTGTAQLYIYVLESSSPRIIVEGTGAVAEEPYPLQVQGASADDTTVKSYLSKAIPYFEAYDLEDGDISYKVSVSEDEAYDSLVAALKSDAASEGTVYSLSLTVSDSDGNTPSPLPVFYVTVVTDTTPPVITLDNEQAMYTIEIDAWHDNTKAWTDLFQSLGAKVIDNSWKEQIPKPFTPNTTVEGLAANGVDDTELKKALTMNGDRSKFAENYDANNAAAPLNYKKVTLWATDAAGNTGKKEITVYLTDTTAPEIIKSNITIPFGASSVTEAYQLKWQDNSGAEGTCSGLKLSDIDNALTEGSFNVTFTATHTNNTTKTSTLIYPVRVGSPLLSSSGGSWKNNNLLAQAGVNYNFLNGTKYSANDGKNVAQNCNPITPKGWSFVNPRNETDSQWYWTAVDSGYGPINSVTAADTDNDCIVCAGLTYPQSNATVGAYMTCGNLYIKYSGFFADVYVRNVTVGISADAQLSLYNSVTYEIGYDAADFYISGDGIPDIGGKRELSVSVTGGTGRFGDKTSVQAEYSAGVTNKTTSHAYQSLETLVSGSGSYNDWEYISTETTINGGNVSSINLHYSVYDPGDSADYGSLVTNFRICPVKWKGKENRNDPNSKVGYWSYDTSTGKVSWSEG